eukprot:5759073-Pyramimonas_sp.AAC.1
MCSTLASRSSKPNSFEAPSFDWDVSLKSAALRNWMMDVNDGQPASTIRSMWMHRTKNLET